MDDRAQTYNDLMYAFEEMVGKFIVDNALSVGLKPIEAYIVVENVLKTMKEDIRSKKR
ncbi:MAG: hypothetical protein IH840_08275 [Candidatus Heimdallarchaeota archaeon]|nr:hypothetical protein [Candidatus Heimdallarchaeota archaeon]